MTTVDTRDSRPLSPNTHRTKIRHRRRLFHTRWQAVVVLTLIMHLNIGSNTLRLQRMVVAANASNRYATIHSSRMAFLGISSDQKRSASQPTRRASNAPNTRIPVPPESTQLSGTSASSPDISARISASGYKRPTVNWYPGHIAKAERALAETLKSVDVVIEVRDARAPKATAHPRVGEWSAGKPRVVVLTRVDMVPAASVQEWKESYEVLGAGNWDEEVELELVNRVVQADTERKKYLEGSDTSGGGDVAVTTKTPVSRVEEVLFLDAKRGKGIHGLSRAVLRVGSHINVRRARRGLSSRALRVGIIGYPNVGKSALINRLLGRKRAKSADTPGITRSLQWIRVKTDSAKLNSSGKKVRNDFELLDSPGIIPMSLSDAQSDALLVAACNSIGTGAYDNQAVASYFMEWCKTLHLMDEEDGSGACRGAKSAPKFREMCRVRYGFDPLVPVELPKAALNSVYSDVFLDPYRPVVAAAPTSTNSNTRDEHTPMTKLMSGEDMLHKVADNTCYGDVENASRKILQDFRGGRLGPIALQLAPTLESTEGQTEVPIAKGTTAFDGADWREEDSELRREEERRERVEKAALARGLAKEKGLELPPGMDEIPQETVNSETKGGLFGDEDTIGKGAFDGW